MDGDGDDRTFRLFGHLHAAFLEVQQIRLLFGLVPLCPQERSDGYPVLDLVDAHQDGF